MAEGRHDTAAHRDLAHQENVFLLKGVPVSRRADDCDTCHVNQHARLVETPIFEKASDDVKKAVRAHFDEHVAQLFAKGDQAYASEAQREVHDLVQSNQMGKPTDRRFPSDIVPVP